MVHARRLLHAHLALSPSCELLEPPLLYRLSSSCSHVRISFSCFSCNRTTVTYIHTDDDEEEEEEGGGGGSGKKKRKKPMRYKDVVREQILHAETAEDAISSDEDGDGDGNRGSRNDNGGEGRRGLAYDEEQERLRKGLLGSIAEHDGGSGDGSEEDSGEEGDGLLKVRIGYTGLRREGVFVFSCWCWR